MAEFGAIENCPGCGEDVAELPAGYPCPTCGFQVDPAVLVVQGRRRITALAVALRGLLSLGAAVGLVLAGVRGHPLLALSSALVLLVSAGAWWELWRRQRPHFLICDERRLVYRAVGGGAAASELLALPLTEVAYTDFGRGGDVHIYDRAGRRAGRLRYLTATRSAAQRLAGVILARARRAREGPGSANGAEPAADSDPGPLPRTPVKRR